MRPWLLAILAVLAAPGSGAGAEVVAPAPLDTVLARHLRGGRVDYVGLAADPPRFGPGGRGP